MQNFRMDYDSDGDILEVVWQQDKTLIRTGIELNDNIVLFADSELSVPLGLMFISYSHLIKASVVELTGLASLPDKRRERVLRLLKTSRVAPFLSVASNGQTVLADPTVCSLAAA